MMPAFIKFGKIVIDISKFVAISVNNTIILEGGECVTADKESGDLLRKFFEPCDWSKMKKFMMRDPEVESKKAKKA